MTNDDKKKAFIRAVNNMQDAENRWKERAEIGLTDEQLSQALRYELGIAGGSGGRDALSIAYEGSGLKIWAGWQNINPYMDQPIFEGQKTVKMARIVFGIADPSDKQMALF